MATRFVHEQLCLAPNATHADHQIDISARYVQIGHFGFKDPAITVDLAVAGLGGLDTGSEAANTWYNIYLITDARGSAINAVMSVATTVPTYPAGYTDSVYIGAVKNSAASAIRPFINKAGSNHFIWAEDWSAAPYILYNGAGSATFTTLTAATTQGVLAPKAMAAKLYVQFTLANATVGFTAVKNPDNGGSLGEIYNGGGNTGHASVVGSVGWSTCDASRQLQFRGTNGVGDTHQIYCLGYEDIR